MSSKLPSDAVQRLAETSARYREAFAEVQDILERTDLGRVPAWVFAIDRLPIEEVREMSPELGAAEERRRTWRTCLQALAEHLALEDDGTLGDAETTDEVDGLVAALDHEGDADHLRKLDRFIAVVNFAKAGGCIYVDGGFQPVRAPAAPRKAAPSPASPFPQGANIELADALPSPAGSSKE